MTLMNDARHAPVTARRQSLRAAVTLAGWPLLQALAGCASPLGSRSPGAAGAAPAAPAAAGTAGDTRLGFTPVPPSRADALSLPPGYEAQVLLPWGDPVGLPGPAAMRPAFRFDAGNSAAEQALQLGMHHDGMAFFPLAGRSDHGLLVINHEYIDDGLLYPDGRAGWNAEKLAKAQAAHGISVCELKRDADGRWQPVSPSAWARRITARTPCALGGPAAGHPLLRTAADPEGRRVTGTLANCGGAATPWGTFLSGEENFGDYFQGPAQPDAHQARWGLRPGDALGLGWAALDERFDANRHPQEFHRFGWVVEVDPFDPQSTPVKRTALGRAMHEGATTVLTRDGRAVVYMGEDERFEYLTRFVSRDAMRPGGARANATLLDHGTLWVARFDAGGQGRWLPMVWGQGPLTPANGFHSQAEVLVHAREAADALGATRLDRAEWTAVAADGWAYAALTNNSRRGAPGRPGVDAANPRANNTMGGIVRWRGLAADERGGGDHDAETFRWEHLLLAGHPANARPEAQGTVRGDAFANPDALWVDGRGVLWVGTDMAPEAIGQGEWAAFGNNQLLAADPATGELRRFLVGPVGCELTGLCGTPDGRTLFVNIQHPGETPSYRSDPAQPRARSNWPDFRPDGRPRSATLAIRRRDGGLIGS